MLSLVTYNKEDENILAAPIWLLLLAANFPPGRSLHNERQKQRAAAIGDETLCTIALLTARSSYVAQPWCQASVALLH